MSNIECFILLCSVYIYCSVLNKTWESGNGVKTVEDLPWTCPLHTLPKESLPSSGLSPEDILGLAYRLPHVACPVCFAQNKLGFSTLA